MLADDSYDDSLGGAHGSILGSQEQRDAQMIDDTMIDKMRIEAKEKNRFY